MSDMCCCGGRCNPPEPSALSRRGFLQTVAAGTAGLALSGELAWAGPADTPATAPALPDRSRLRDYPLTRPRVYKGKNLEAVAMPIGGIGTGSVWLDGQGRLAVWQIFNNLSETRIPDSFFAVTARAGDGKEITRVLQTAAEGDLPPVASLEYEGGYPIARLRFHDPALPVQVSLEAFNPMIPLDTANSTIPCAVFRLTATNPGPSPAEVSFRASLQNAVGSQGAGEIRGVRFEGYGGNRNRVVREQGLVAVAMDKSPDPVRTGPVKVRSAAGQEVSGPEMLWLAGVPGLTAEVAEAMARVAAEGGIVLADGVSPAFFAAIAALRRRTPEVQPVVFEDFERNNYQGWTITGEAFGKAPSRGTEAGQQPVSGFAGRRLVNTFIAGDGPQGTATSKPFRIEKRHIGFLIGGGNHPGQTCINLRVDGKVVRTATGKNQEALEPASWDVADLVGKEAVIEIVDRHSGGWGHINVDQIVLADVPPEPFLKQGTAADAVAKALAVSFEKAEEATRGQGKWSFAPHPAAKTRKSLSHPWDFARFTRLRGFRDGEGGYRALVTAAEGDPLMIEGPLGKGRVILALAPGLPWSWGSIFLAAARAEPLKAGERLVPGSPGWGSMALAALDGRATASPAPGPSQAEEATSKPGETINANLAVPFTLPPGASHTVTFVLTWHFPNVQRFQHAGNLYSRRWPDALAVARYVAQHAGPLWERTRLYHDTVYQSNLPEEFLDAMTSQVAILRGPTCFWSEDGYFGGFEGSYGCCPLNCTHVWNYAQTHARLFPEVGRNMRIADFVTYLHADGETSHRQHGPHNAFIDGHCACIEAAYREHLLSPDRSFLEKVWPGVKKAVDWMIGAFDKKREGIPGGHQWNTYDTAVSGANTFIGSQYLSALAAGERMALAMSDPEAAARWRAVREAGMRNQNERLWGGEYYIQVPDPEPARDYNNGCHADQLLGQWWAHMLGLGYLYPAGRVRRALEAVMTHNFRESFAGFKQAPRRYVLDDEGGLVICTWPKNDRPKSFILYADEVWTGIEYAAAGAMIYEGLVDHARRIVRTARGRYDGRRRGGLDSGPGGNPYNELECGKFYARAMSSWSLLVASQGQVLDGPKGLLGFQPRWQPEDHRSFYAAPEGWGMFAQHRAANRQTERIEVRHGRLCLRELVFELPAEVEAAAAVTIGRKPAGAVTQRKGKEVRLLLERPAVVLEGNAVEVTFQWT